MADLLPYAVAHSQPVPHKRGMLELPRQMLLPVRGWLARYATGIGLFLVGFFVRYFSDHVFPPGFPFLTFFPAVIVATLLAGRGPGIVCAILSGLAAWYWFMAPLHTFTLDAQTATALGFFAVVTAFDIYLIDALVSRQRQLEENEQRMTRMAETQRLLFMELQHRVANNLASIAAMLRLKRRQILASPESAPDLLDRAEARIEMMGRVHRQLYAPSAQEIPVADHIRKAVEQTRDLAAARQVRVNLHIAPARLETNRLLTLILLISELLTNSFKHAFADQSDPVVTLTLEHIDPLRLRLTVADNGCGLPDETKPSPKDGLGQMIIRGFVAQLGGTMTSQSLPASDAGGLSTVIEFAES